MSEIWDIPSPYKPGAQNSVFRQLCNSTVTLTTYIFGTKHDIHNRTGVYTHPRYFVPSQFIAHPLSGIYVAPI